jgi:hypothetical protein
MHPSLLILAADSTPANFWSAFPSLVWPALTAAAIWWLRKDIRTFLFHFGRRLRSGASIKIGQLQVGAVTAVSGPSVPGLATANAHPTAAARGKERDGVYADARGAMLVHRIFRSDQPGQHYDILIYLIPHKASSFAAITRVEYFLGSYWDDEVYTATDRAHGFAMLTAAYGSFLCTAHVHFSDGYVARLHRYIDFEMGQSAPFVEHPTKKADDEN